MILRVNKLCITIKWVDEKKEVLGRYKSRQAIKFYFYHEPEKWIMLCGLDVLRHLNANQSNCRESFQRKKETSNS